jgi:CBS domain-containing protein
MDKLKLTVDECMSPSPVSIQYTAPLVEAEALMRKFNIRHLPVMEGTELVGLLSIRDVHVVHAVEKADPATITAGQAAGGRVYAVQVGTDLRQVAANMGGHKYGSAVVLDGTKVVGVFTTVDALRVLINLLG